MSKEMNHIKTQAELLRKRQIAGIKRRLQAIETANQTLDDELREAVYDGLSIRDVALLTGLSPSTVHRRAHAAAAEH